MRRVTTAAPTIGQRVHTLNRPNMVSVGTIIWLSSELMFFAGLFAMFFTVKAQNTTGSWPPPPIKLDYMVSIPATIILVLSSVTCQLGVFAAEKGDVFGLRRWYTITSSAWGSVFFISTGFHGLHVLGGLVAFIFLMIRTRLSKFTPAQATATIVVSYYWHFVDVVWIGLFTCVELLH
jgi:cytochrome c oxidase subunit 3